VQPTEQDMDLVTFLVGRVATNDNTALPMDVLVERVCYERVRQQVYATSRGDFSMQLGLRPDSFPDDGDDPALQPGMANQISTEGIPRRDLVNCELRVSAAGFYPNSISLMDLNPSERTVNVGSIVVQRAAKIKGTTVSAAAYKAPPSVRKAYEKGLEAENKGKLAEARKYFEQALGIYPRFANAWFQLGTILEKENLKDSARSAYAQATTIDAKFLPAYLALASMAFDAGNWTEVLRFTDYILDHDMLNYAKVTDYIVDLDEFNPAEAYFYNAVANYKLNKIEEAEKSALKAERVNIRTDFPLLHLILGEIFARKKDYAVAMSELQTYLDLAPHAKNADQVREKLAGLEKLNRSAPTSEKPTQN
jgi:predicted nucleic acid-binding protein